MHFSRDTEGGEEGADVTSLERVWASRSLAVRRTCGISATICASVTAAAAIGERISKGCGGGAQDPEAGWWA